MSKMTKTDGGRMLTTLPEPAREIWFAGLGAVAMAEKEGGKFFRQLVSEGKRFEKTNLARVEKGFDSVLTTVNARVSDVRAIPGAAMDRMGGVVDDSMTAVLHRLGVPTKREISVLTRRVEELTRSLESKPARPRRAPATRRARATKRTKAPQATT
ncbi:MAG: phasin family protein [Gemmatimonadaceae bacterium]